MSARMCFTGKIAAGAVNPRAGEAIVRMIDEFAEKHRKTLGDAAGLRLAAGGSCGGRRRRCCPQGRRIPRHRDRPGQRAAHRGGL
jgi:hypothetical protein